MTVEMYDYVIIGAGSAGCAVAGRLSENPDITVAVIEAGPPPDERLAAIPALFSQQLKTSYDWDLETEPEPALGGRRAYLPRGRMVGGTSSMNTMLYVRGSSSDYDGWRDRGHDGWGYADVLPWFLRSEDNERGAGPFHGVGGPLRVSDPRSVHPLLSAWIEAAHAAGHARNADFNGAAHDGVGAYQVTQRDGLRCSSADAFLVPAAGRPNLTVLPSTQALLIGLDGDRATSVTVDHLGEVRRIGIGTEVILSAGAYLSPHLLLQSGIGPAAELAEGGVRPLHDLPGVGRNLLDHVGCFLSFFSRIPPIVGADTSAEEARLRRDGDGPMTWSEVGGFMRSSDALEAADIQLHAALGIVRDQGLTAGPERGIAFGPYVGRPQSTGTVRVRHPNPYAKPRIVHGYLSVHDDRVRLREGIRAVMRIAGEPALATLLDCDLAGAARHGLAPDSDTDAAIDAYIERAAFSFYHPAGSCAMGTVVDAELRVHGLANVRVADTSVMPTLITGNTNAPAIMIGERAAGFIRESWTR